MFKKWRLMIALATALCVPVAAFADDLLAIQQDEHGVDYVTGGIGSEEVEAMEAFKSQFNMYFLFSEGKAGRLVDDVSVSILDSKKQPVFNVEHAAPRLLLNLPNGTYTVVATYLGNTQQYGFSSSKKHQRIILNWKTATPDEETIRGQDEGSSEPQADTAE